MTSVTSAFAARCWRLPRWMAAPFRALYHLHFGLAGVLRWFYRVFYAGPMFRAHCGAVGKGFDMMKIPDTPGHCDLALGENVRFHGHMGAASGRIFDRPHLSFGDGVEVGHDCGFTVNREVSIGKGTWIGAGTRFMDSDAHPRDPLLRAAGAPPAIEEIKPVHVGDNVAIGRGCFILKGVTIGDGTSVSPGSVVVADLPARVVAGGNPARILSRMAKPTPTADQP